jgi:hypothetical protein
MAENTQYQQLLTEALDLRRNWLEENEMPKLKEEFRSFHNAFYALYKLFLKRGLIHEDPYKQEAKMGEIEVPAVSPFTDADRLDQLSLRLSEFDTQLDFLVNFYQFSVDALPLDRIKRILGLVNFIDWVRFTPDGRASPNTQAVVELVNNARAGADQLSMSIIGESMTALSKSTGPILTYLMEVSDYHREAYKLELRTRITAGMSDAEASQINQIKRKFAQQMPGKPFYPDLVEELIREDYSRNGADLREKALNRLAIPRGKTKTVKSPVSFKNILIEGFYAIGSVSSTLEEIVPKLDENETLLEKRRRSFWEKFRRLMMQVLNQEPEPAIYELECIEPGKGVTSREKVNFNTLRLELERKIKNLAPLGARGGAAAKLEAMEETQLMGLLERYIRDIQSLHKTLTALDDFFKASVDTDDRSKVKGIKPELAVIKNAIIKANQKLHEYTAQKEEEEQFKRLGIGADA